MPPFEGKESGLWSDGAETVAARCRYDGGLTGQVRSSSLGLGSQRDEKYTGRLALASLY
jgi:hypothetical protein